MLLRRSLVQEPPNQRSQLFTVRIVREMPRILNGHDFAAGNPAAVIFSHLDGLKIVAAVNDERRGGDRTQCVREVVTPAHREVLGTSVPSAHEMWRRRDCGRGVAAGRFEKREQFGIPGREFGFGTGEDATKVKVLGNPRVVGWHLVGGQPLAQIVEQSAARRWEDHEVGRCDEHEASLLGRMAAKVSAAADSHTETDIRQLQGLAEQQDKEAFLPLRQEELGPQLPRRVIDLTRIVDDAVHRVRKTEWVSVKGARMAATATSYGIWLTFPRAEKVFGKFSSYFGVSYGHWARYRDTPLWLRFSNPPADLRRRLEQLRDRNRLELIGTGRKLRIPIELPVGRERGEVLDAVVARLLEIARLITPE